MSSLPCFFLSFVSKALSGQQQIVGKYLLNKYKAAKHQGGKSQRCSVQGPLAGLWGIEHQGCICLLASRDTCLVWTFPEESEELTVTLMRSPCLSLLPSGFLFRFVVMYFLEACLPGVWGGSPRLPCPPSMGFTNRT